MYCLDLNAMQNAEQAQKGGERSLDSSGSSVGTHDDLANWGKQDNLQVQGGMASARRSPSVGRSGGGLVGNDRHSSATVFEGGFEEGAVDVRRQLSSGTTSPTPPSIDTTSSKGGKAPFPVPPPDMEDIA